MISPELPCVYGSYYDATNATGKALYMATWTQYIQTLRNHPSIFDWAMCNEYSGGIAQNNELYDIAKALDPTRYVIDADGLFAGCVQRKSLEFCSMQFDVNNMGNWGNVALDNFRTVLCLHVSTWVCVVDFVCASQYCACVAVRQCGGVCV
jgi:hypothetical protein